MAFSEKAFIFVPLFEAQDSEKAAGLSASCTHSLMDKISDSGSEDAGSIPAACTW